MRRDGVVCFEGVEGFGRVRLGVGGAGGGGGGSLETGASVEVDVDRGAVCVLCLRDSTSLSQYFRFFS